jgi:hypothetical protein
MQRWRDSGDKLFLGEALPILNACVIADGVKEFVDENLLLSGEAEVFFDQDVLFVGKTKTIGFLRLVDGLDADFPMRGADFDSARKHGFSVNHGTSGSYCMTAGLCANSRSQEGRVVLG